MNPAIAQHAQRLTTVLTDYIVSPRMADPMDWLILDHKSGDGRNLHVSIDDRKEQYAIRGCWPFSDYQGFNNQFRPNDSVEIRVSWKKTDKALSADIWRRLLEWYDLEHKVQIGRRDQHDNQLRAREVTMKEFGTLLECNVTDAHSGSNPRVAEEVHAYRYGVDKFRANYNGTEVQLTLCSLPIGIAKTVVQFLKDSGIPQKTY